MERNTITSNAAHNEPEIKSYKSRVAAQCLRNPCLQTLSRFLSEDDSDRNACRIVCLELSPVSAAPRRANLDLNNLTSLLNNKVPGRKETQGRLLLVEDLSKDIVEVLGSSLNIDPFFFASHLDVPQPNIATTRPYTVTLPSVTKSQNFLTLHYHRVLALEHTAIRDRLLRDMNAPRKLKILPSVKGLDIGLARHCCSILETIGKDGLWLGVVLVDASLTDSFVFTRHYSAPTITRIRSQPFQGGFEDFLPGSSFLESNNSNTGPARRSLLEDLIFYWSNRRPPAFNAIHPTLFSLSYYPLRIIAAEWKMYLEVMYHSTKHYEYNPSKHANALAQLATLTSDLSALQKWARRRMATSHKIQCVIGFLKERSTEDRDADARNLLMEDYEHINSSLAIYGHRLDAMVPIVTSMIQIIDSQRSLIETSKISRLSNLALIFVPLQFVSSLFSMNEVTVPGSKGVWLYFIVAVPLSTVVFFIARPPRRMLRLLAAWVWTFGESAQA